MMGEDETKCTNICTDETGCALNCSYMNKCICLRGFFQCICGGCIPVGKLCDRRMVQMNQCHVNLTQHKYKGLK